MTQLLVLSNEFQFYLLHKIWLKFSTLAITLKEMLNASFKGDFIEQVEAIILDNILNEQFGVSELADIMNMSRSNLLRKIKKQTNLSASQFIRKVRLQKSMELLKLTELTVSEISYQVGFGNTSYFIKCFREFYGLPPGEVRKGTMDSVDITNEASFFKKNRLYISLTASFIAIIAIIFFVNKKISHTTVIKPEAKKSIAILPFKNMSNDSNNLYFVNGLMEATLNNLQKIEDLRVISRTSVEKYRNTEKSISEIAKELNVNYLVEGSGQRIGDQVLLNIHLIEALNDSPIWIEQYSQKIVDLFSLQNEIAKKIADAIEAKVTPEELKQIDKKPTKNLVAYDFYLQGLEFFQAGTKEGLEKAIPLFEKALEYDSQFALAYSKIAISYYFLEENQIQKQYINVINNNADKALLYDSKSEESLIAKALYYIHNQEYRLAVPHLEKALEYNPNSSTVIQILSDLYARVIPNTAKYLNYALKGIQLDIAANDSIGQSYIYLHLSNALIQTGFVEEASKYINLSINQNQKNSYSPFLKIFIDYAKEKDLKKATNLLVKEWKRDTTRLDILQEVGKFYYYQEKYDSAYYYYKSFVEAKKKNNLAIYPQEDLKIGIVYEKMGLEQANDFYKSYTDYCENDQSIYQPASLAMKYLHERKFDLAVKKLNEFAEKDNFQYWILLFLEKDPLMKTVKNKPEFDNILKKIKNKFWENHSQLKKTLEVNGLI